MHPVGAVGTPSITFTGDLDTGIYHPSAGEIAFSINGVQNLRLGFQAFFSVHINGVSGGISGAWTADSLDAASSLSSAITTVLAFDNAAGILTIGNSTVDPNDPPVAVHTFLGNGNVGFFVATPVGQQSAPTDSLSEVITALRAYGLLAPP